MASKATVLPLDDLGVFYHSISHRGFSLSIPSNFKINSETSQQLSSWRQPLSTRQSMMLSALFVRSVFRLSGNQKWSISLWLSMNLFWKISCLLASLCHSRYLLLGKWKILLPRAIAIVLFFLLGILPLTIIFIFFPFASIQPTLKFLARETYSIFRICTRIRVNYFVAILGELLGAFQIILVFHLNLFLDNFRKILLYEYSSAPIVFVVYTDVLWSNFDTSKVRPWKTFPYIGLLPESHVSWCNYSTTGIE